ncbi:MAG TPA: metallophosphatase [Planctomycetes bacterium]|nr:metallophosphatase [Planctomycetota bacterium]
MSGRTIFIGDVQGCLTELKLLLDRVQLGQEDQCCFVGDLVNRGPDSLGVLRLFQELGGISVLGNHEAQLLKRGFFQDPGDRQDWGPLSPLAQAPDRKQLGQLITGFPLLLCFPGVILVHAGLPPSLWDGHKEQLEAWDGKTLDPSKENEEVSFILSARYCDPSGKRPPRDYPPPGPPFQPWDHYYRGKPRVVFGHWARRGLVRTPKVLGLDSGCVYGGKLSAWIKEEDRIVQVNARKAYWPIS